MYRKSCPTHLAIVMLQVTKVHAVCGSRILCVQCGVEVAVAPHHRFCPSVWTVLSTDAPSASPTPPQSIGVLKNAPDSATFRLDPPRVHLRQLRLVHAELGSIPILYPSPKVCTHSVPLMHLKALVWSKHS